MAQLRNTRREDKAIAYIKKVYADLDDKLQAEIEDAAKSGNTDLANDLQRRQARIAALVASATASVTTVVIAMLAAGYEGGLDYIIKKIRGIIPARQVNALFSDIDRETLRALAQTTLGTFATTDQIVATRASELVRTIAINNAQAAFAEGDTLLTAAERIERALLSSGATQIDGKVRFVSINGRNYQLDSYAELVARTATRQSATKAMSNRLLENGLDLVEIDDNEDACDICSPLTGQTYSITGQTKGYELVPEIPVHPNCRCVLSPAPLV